MIEVKNITRDFGKGFGIFDVSFNIPDGKIIAFIGDNGAGKTTTINAISSELKLQFGEVLIDGESIFENNNLQHVAFFPDTDLIPKNMTIHDYVRYVSAAHGVRKKEMEERIENIYEMLGISEIKDKKIKLLSSGLKKRGIMSAVLIVKPKYIFFDEPTANLDIEAKLEFIQIIKTLKSMGVTVIITSHLIEELQEIADHLVLIQKGKIVYDKSFDGNNERIMDIYKKFAHPTEIKDDVIGELYGGEK